MEIAFDPEKDRANRAKHGVGLAMAAALDWAGMVVIEDARAHYGEVRWRGFARMEARLYCCVWTLRDGRVRVISLRKANKREVRAYG